MHIVSVLPMPSDVSLACPDPTFHGMGISHTREMTYLTAQTYRQEEGLFIVSFVIATSSCLSQQMSVFSLVK